MTLPNYIAVPLNVLMFFPPTTAQFKDPATNHIGYMNKRTGVIQHTQPDNFNEERVELWHFQYLTLSNGTELTTMTDDNGHRLYLDWDQQVCR